MCTNVPCSALAARPYQDSNQNRATRHVVGEFDLLEKEALPINWSSYGSQGLSITMLAAVSYRERNFVGRK